MTPRLNAQMTVVVCVCVVSSVQSLPTLTKSEICNHGQLLQAEYLGVELL